MNIRLFLISGIVSAAFTIGLTVALGQDGYESPVLDDDSGSFTQAFQKRINESGTAAQQPVQPPVQQNVPAKQPVPDKINRGGLFERVPSDNQSNGKNNSSAPVARSGRKSGRERKRPLPRLNRRRLIPFRRSKRVLL